MATGQGAVQGAGVRDPLRWPRGVGQRLADQAGGWDRTVPFLTLSLALSILDTPSKCEDRRGGEGGRNR